MAQYHARPAAQRARSPPPPPPPPPPAARPSAAAADSNASSLLFPSLPASAPLDRGRSQDVRPAASVAVEADWSLILPAPASRSTSYQRPPTHPSAGPSIWREHRPTRLDAYTHHPFHDGRSDLLVPAGETTADRRRPALTPRTPSEQTYGSSTLDELSTTDPADDFSSLASTTDYLDSSASDREPSPGRSSPIPYTAPFSLSSRSLASTNVSADSSPSPPLGPELGSLSRVPTIVGLSTVRSQGSFAMAASADTAGFRPTFTGARAGSRAAGIQSGRERRMPILRQAGPPQSHPVAVGEGGPARKTGPSASTLGWSWPFRAHSAVALANDPPSPSAGPALLATTFGILRSLLAMDESALLLLLASPLTETAAHASSTEPIDWSEKDPVLEHGGVSPRTSRPRIYRRSSSFDPGTDGRRALLLRAVDRVTGQS